MYAEEGITKDYRVTVKVRNARIINALAERGEVVGQIAATKIGVSYAKLLALSNITLSPVDAEGNIIPEVLKLCDYLNKMPLELFSVDQIVPLKTNTAELDMSLDEVEMLMLPASERPDPELLFANGQFNNAIKYALETLPPREAKVLQLRFGIDCEEHTYEGLGQIMGISKERVRQIEASALRKLRHPSRFDKLQIAAPMMPMPEKKKKEAV
jgi:RNA polymerase sigma factor (sigma-70 family)